MMNERTLRSLEFGRVLDHLARFCLSGAGAEACRELSPLAAADAVHAAHRMLDDFRTWIQESPCKPAPFPDIRPLFGYARAETDPLSPLDPLDADALWTLRQALAPVRQLAQTLLAETAGSPRYPALSSLAAFPLPEMTMAALNRCLGDDGLLRDESSPELMLARTELRRLHQTCLHQVRDFSERYNIGHYLQDAYMTLASDRYVLPLKANFKGRLQGILHDYSQTGETCYFEPMFLIEHNNRLRELKRVEREEEHKVLVFLTRIVRNEIDGIRAAWDLLVALDVLRAKALLGDAYQGVSVTMGEGPDLNLTRARHPLLALELRDKAQPVDLVLRHGDQALIISGGNAGGKTVCLKTLGLIAAMTFAGIPVPVERGGTLPWWPDIQAFIGDEQSLDDHVSTFTAQIRHLTQAWPHTGRHSLVLLDEFGAGTDPAQGAALAQAVIDELIERGAFVVAATHFPALKAYALTRDRARAASVLFDPGTRRPLFRLAYDQVGASLALDVAREHGLPEAVLRRAEHYLLLDGQDTGAVLQRLNALTAERERETERLREEQARLKDKRIRLQERFDQDRASLEQEVRDASRTIMREWQAGRLAHKQAVKELARKRTDLAALRSEEARAAQTAPGNPLPGQIVLYLPWSKRAVVSEVDTQKGKVKLDLNGVRLWADATQIADPAAQGAPLPLSGMPAGTARGSRPAVQNTGGKTEIPLLTLDLRGKRADLAEGELLRFLDAALLAGREGVEIIHGRGTGVLRRQVHAVLGTFPGIASYALAPEDRGGDGMTTVSFR